jgi:hypothetical protein
MLPGWADCARRAGAKQFPTLLASAGFEVPKLLPSIGASVGTATHRAAEFLFRSKMQTGQVGSMGEALTAAKAKLREEIATGCEWDDTSPNLQVAELQVTRLTEALLPLALASRPVAVELSLSADLGDGWAFSGHVDLVEEGGHLDDLKTGAVRRPYQAQLGGYSLLARSNGHEVSSVGITFLPRGKKTRPQPPPERQRYDLATAERAAWTTIERIKTDVEKFERTGDPFAFEANPMSMMCTPNYCPAWGTDFCRMHLPNPVHTDAD